MSHWRFWFVAIFACLNLLSNGSYLNENTNCWKSENLKIFSDKPLEDNLKKEDDGKSNEKLFRDERWNKMCWKVLPRWRACCTSFLYFPLGLSSNPFSLQSTFIYIIYPPPVYTCKQLSFTSRPKLAQRFHQQSYWESKVEKQFWPIQRHFCILGELRFLHETPKGSIVLTNMTGWSVFNF